MIQTVEYIVVSVLWSIHGNPRFIYCIFQNTLHVRVIWLHSKFRKGPDTWNMVQWYRTASIYDRGSVLRQAWCSVKCRERMLGPVEHMQFLMCKMTRDWVNGWLVADGRMTGDARVSWTSCLVSWQGWFCSDTRVTTKNLRAADRNGRLTKIWDTLQTQQQCTLTMHTHYVNYCAVLIGL